MSLSVQVLLLAAAYQTHIFHCWPVHLEVKCFWMPYQGVGGVIYTAEWGCVGLAKTGESFNISSGLQRTAEGLECFQMVLQQKQALASRQAHPSQPQSFPASNLQSTVHSVRMYKACVHLWMRSTHSIFRWHCAEACCDYMLIQRIQGQHDL